MPLTSSPPRSHRLRAPARTASALIGAGAIVAAVLTPIGAAAEERDLVLDHGHIDAFNFVLDENGAPELNLKEDVTGSHVTHPPEDVELVVKEQALVNLPDIAAIPEELRGEDAYHLPLTQDPDLIWPGWDTQGIGSSYGNVDIVIDDVSGPGEAHLWTIQGFGELKSLLVDGGTQLPGTIRQATPAHVHANWAFTEPGEYRMTVHGEATHTDSGQIVESNTAEYLFSVGEYVVPESVSIEGLQESYEPGAPIELTAVPDVDVEGATYRWETLTTDGDWLPIEGQDSAVFTGEAVLDGQRIRAVVEAAGATVASEAVAIVIAEEPAPEPEPELPSSLTLSGLQDEYAPGDVVTLEAKPDIVVENPVFEWETSPDGSAWEVDEAHTGSVWSGEAQDGLQVRATIVVDGVRGVTSAPVVVVVSDDEPAPEPELPTEVEIDGLEKSYERGDEVRLTARPDVEVDDAAFRWETSEDGSSWTEDDSTTGATWTGAAEEGLRVRATLVVDGEDIVTSRAVVIRVDEPAPEPDVCYALDIDRGHVDAFNIVLQDGEPALTLKEDVTGSHVVRSPDEVNLVVKEQALIEAPDVDAVPEGVRGEEGYLLPLIQDQELLWPGWDSQELAGSAYDQVDIAIEDVSGPGEIHLWSEGSLGGLRSLLTDGGTELPGTIHQEYLAHVHANWFFTEPGAYRLTVSATAIDSDSGAQARTDTEEYVFSVGDFEADPADYACPGGGDGEEIPEPKAPEESDLTDDAAGDVTVDPDSAAPGEQVEVTVPGAKPGTQVAAYLFSVPTLLNEGRVTVRSGGTFLATIPENALPGDHRLAVVGEENELLGWADLTVTSGVPDEDQKDDEDRDGSTTPPPGDAPGGSTPAGAAPAGQGGAGGASPQGTVAGADVCLPAKPAGAPAGTGDSTKDEDDEKKDDGKSDENGGEGAAAVTAAPLAGATEPVIGTEGHFDFGPVVEDGAFTFQVKDDRTAPPVWRAPGSVAFELGDAARHEASEIPDELSFIADGSDDIWMIQQIQEPGVPWLGWNTQHETIVNGPGSSGVEMTLESVEGPGDMALFLSGTFGSLVGERVVDNVGGPTSYTIPANTHQHGNWVFTAPGEYAVTFTFSADGESVTDTLNFAVGVEATTPSGGDGGSSTETGGAGDSTTAGGSGKGVTPDGKPCTLERTGDDLDLTPIGTTAALLLVVGGVLLWRLRRQARLNRA